jgi:hypothetical protein
VKLSKTHDFELRTPKVDASYLHKSLDMILRLSSYLESTNSCFSFFDKVWSKDNLLSRLNPIEWSAASTPV